MNKHVVRAMLALGSAAAASLLYAAVIEPRWLRCTHTRLHFRRLPRQLEGLRIALLTDLHANAHTPRDLLRRVVDETNAARADVVAITGDIAENEAALGTALEALARLHAPFGVYIVPGNHDYRDVGIERWHDAVSRRPSLINLTNAVRIIRVSRRRSNDDEARLCIAGVDDLSHGQPRLDLLPPPPSRDFTVLLAHHPDQAEHVRRAADDVDLVLSGHTHGGQVRLPGYGAVVSSSNHPDLYEAGVRRRPWTQVYTSRGIGTTHLPVRFFAPPEIAILTLTAAARPRRPWRGIGR
jgi:uncharacterized protein